MNTRLRIFITIAAFAGLCVMAWGENPLPRVKIMGKSFYYYESKKGESLYGIAERFGWDPALLEKTNREVTSDLDAGTLLYYPVGKSESASAGKETESGVDSARCGRVTHTVSSGETAYGISKLYNVSLESLYALNPDIVKHGLKKGDTLIVDTAEVVVSQDPESESKPKNESSPATADSAEVAVSDSVQYDSGSKYIYHRVGEEESLYGIAKAYNTTVGNLFESNPGLTSGNPREGDVIRLMADASAPEKHVETVDERRVASLSAYKVRRGDSWESVAMANGIPVDELKNANPGVSRLKKGETIRIPQMETIKVERVYVAEDPRENNPSGVKELYNEVHDIEAPEASDGTGIVPEVGVAIVLTDFGSSSDEKRNKNNKEMEFSRGALTAVDAMKTGPFKTRLTIIDGSEEEQEVVSALDAFGPRMIITTSDRSIPSYIVDYADRNKVMVINSFDAKDETYIENPNVLQYLAPSSYMNSEVADYLVDRYKDYTMIVAGSLDSSDALGAGVVKAFSDLGPERVEEVEVSGIPELELDGEAGKYVIYGTPVSQGDVKSLLEKVNELRSRYVMCDIRVIGRPNWIPYATSLKDLFGDNYVQVPSRFYFDPQDPSTNEFINHYESLFNVRPMKASPVYCATSYDILTYFVPNLASAGGDFNADFTEYPTIQSPMNLKRVSNWGGIINRGVYMISFSPFGISERIRLPHQ